MYSRYKNATYDPRDDDLTREVCEDEYELYRYNLPPRYDGSRFRHRSCPPPKGVTVASEAAAPPLEVCSSSAENRSAASAYAETETEAAALPLPHLTPHGYEDLLIICLILLIAGKDDSAYDITLLLLLLAAK